VIGDWRIDSTSTDPTPPTAFSSRPSSPRPGPPPTLTTVAALRLDHSSGPSHKVERFNRTLLEEWAYVSAYPSEAARRRRLDNWLHLYNLTAATPPSEDNPLHGVFRSQYRASSSTV